MNEHHDNSSDQQLCDFDATVNLTDCMQCPANLSQLDVPTNESSEDEQDQCVTQDDEEEDDDDVDDVDDDDEEEDVEEEDDLDYEDAEEEYFNIINVFYVRCPRSTD